MDLKSMSLRVLSGQLEAQLRKGDKADKGYVAKLMAELERRKGK